MYTLTHTQMHLSNQLQTYTYTLTHTQMHLELLTFTCMHTHVLSKGAQRLHMRTSLYAPSAVELRHCTRLKEINLEDNRISTLVLDLRPMKDSLNSLQVC